MLKPHDLQAFDGGTTEDNMDRRRLAQLLNGISLARVVLAVPVLALILVGPTVQYAYVGAAILFTIAAMTDFLDGYLARRWHCTSELGVFLDTTADKLLVTAALVGLLAVGRVWAWVALIIIGREIAVLGLKGAAASSGTVVYPSIWGKLKFNVQFVAIVLAILRYHERIGIMYLDQWAMTLAAVVTVLSAGSYRAQFYALLRDGHQ
jgi:CDP-diacylglycerol---glycerol-3-phosphate 3-phosphatidyltransferase